MLFTLDGDITLDIPNPSWHRKFKVTDRKEEGTMIFFLCEFTEEEKNTFHQSSRFAKFGAVHERSSGITEAWPIIETLNRDPRLPEWTDDRQDIVTYGKREMERHLCPECRKFVRHKEQQDVLGPELIKVTYTCPNCGHVEEDMID